MTEHRINPDHSTIYKLSKFILVETIPTTLYHFSSIKNGIFIA